MAIIKESPRCGFHYSVQLGELCSSHSACPSIASCLQASQGTFLLSCGLTVLTLIMD